jgi:hypothetical protein
MRACSRAVVFAIVMGGFGPACGDDASQPSESGDAGQDAGAGAEHRELRRVLSAWIDEWDRQKRMQCECLVEAGAYETIDVCFEFLRAGSTWLDCVSTVLADRDSPETRERGRCVLAQLEARNECFEATQCGSEERSECERIALECAKVDPELTVLISEQCPDTTILPRL